MRPWLLYVLVGAAGALIVAGLMLFGIDVVRASRIGPRWKRRLVGLGLVLLGTMGVVALRHDIVKDLPRRLWTPSCYISVEIPYEELGPDGKISALSDRMEAIDKAISASQVTPEVAIVTLNNIEGEARVVAEGGLQGQPTAEQRAEAEQLQRKAAKLRHDVVRSIPQGEP